MHKIVWGKKVALAFLAVALLAGFSSCNLFDGTLTIYNNSSYDIDFVEWTDDDGEVTYFGDDLVWDATLGEWESGILSGSSSTRKVGSGSDSIYFFFADFATFYRTVESVTVGGLSSVSFTFWDSTMISTAQLAEPGRAEGDVVGIVPVPGSKARK